MARDPASRAALDELVSGIGGARGWPASTVSRMVQSMRAQPFPDGDPRLPLFLAGQLRASGLPGAEKAARAVEHVAQRVGAEGSHTQVTQTDELSEQVLGALVSSAAQVRDGAQSTAQTVHQLGTGRTLALGAVAILGGAFLLRSLR